MRKRTFHFFASSARAASGSRNRVNKARMRWIMRTSNTHRLAASLWRARAPRARSRLNESFLLHTLQDLLLLLQRLLRDRRGRDGRAVELFVLRHHAQLDTAIPDRVAVVLQVQ